MADRSLTVAALIGRNLLTDDDRRGVVASVREAYSPGGPAVGLRQDVGVSVQFKMRAAALVADDLDLAPLAVADAGAEGFGGRLFGSPSGGEAADVSVAFGQLALGIDAVQKAGSVAFHGPPDATDLYQVQSNI